MSKGSRPTAILAFTDGACSGNPGPAGIGVVLVCGDRRKEISEYLGEGTSDQLARAAIRHRISRVDPPGSLLRSS
jgi:ribonuclease HI